MFLTDQELKELTGYAFRSRQILWLRKNNWKFEVTAQLRAKVAKSDFEMRLGSGLLNHDIKLSENVLRPNFSALSAMVRP
jgi:hypothetical protein